MDFFAHGFWSYIFFHRIKTPLYAVFFGLVPDLISWTPYFFYNIFTTGFRTGPPLLSQIPDWVFTLYGVGHSLLISSLVILLIFLIFKKFFIFMLAWPIQIALDILTHSNEYLPTPFLWPVSTYAFPGISWGTKGFMLINYSLILIFLGYIAYWKKKHKRD